MFEVKNDPSRLTVYVKMSGFIRAEEMKRCCADLVAATDSYGGKTHFVLADMRGLKPMEQDAGALLGEAIGYTRKRGVALCAHLSDSTIARLQTMKIAREVQTQDSATVDCVSPEEAERLLLEERTRALAGGRARGG